MNATVFHQAVADGDATRVKFLINIGQQARVNQRNKQGYTSLQQSCKDGRYDVADVLLSHGANIAATDKQGRTALHLASAGGYIDIVQLLIASCADINTKDSDGKLAVDVAKSKEITELLQKTAEEKQAKNPEKSKKSMTEDWSKNVTSLPAGSRNSLVSNASSDSGVFTEESSIMRNSEFKLTRPNGYISTRGTVSDSRVMGVLKESDESLQDSGRERARTVHEIGNTVNTDNIYEESLERSNETFANHARISLERNQNTFGNHFNGRISNERNPYELPSHLNVLNPSQHETHLNVQTSMKMAHNVDPQPKLRRSMSERLPPRQRKRIIARRDISQELSALNLSRKVVPQSSYYYEDLNNRHDLRSRNLGSIPEPQSPNEDLGYGGEISNDFEDLGRSSTRIYYDSGSRTLPRNHCRRKEFYPTRDEVSKEGKREEFVSGFPQFVQNTSVSNGIHCHDDVDHYRTAQPKYSRSLRGQTIEICPNVSVEDGCVPTGDWSHACSNNEAVQNYSQREVPRRRMTPENNRFDSRDFEENPINFTLKRSGSACSDTAIASYHRRLMQMYENYVDINSNHDCYYDQGYSQGLPSYEETLQRQRLGSDPRRPASRQVSQV